MIAAPAIPRKLTRGELHHQAGRDPGSTLTAAYGTPRLACEGQRLRCRVVIRRPEPPCRRPAAELRAHGVKFVIAALAYAADPTSY